MTYLDQKHFGNVFSSIDTFLFDCDGVIWSGNEMIKGAPSFLQSIRDAGKRILFVSNNSTKSRKQYIKKFQSLGIEAYENEIFGSAYAAAVYIKNVLEFPQDKRVYVCGMSGIQQELESEGVEWTGGEKEEESLQDLFHVDKIKPDPSIGAVLFGMDVNISYLKYAKAFTYLKSNPDCHFLATNADLTFPAGGTVYPGTGALLAALSAPLKREPIVLGKPNKPMLDAIISKFNLDVNRTVMVGDRLDTDIAFGQYGGLKTILVLSGVTTREEMEKSDIKPDFYVESIGHLNHGLLLDTPTP